MSIRPPETRSFVRRAAHYLAPFETRAAYSISTWVTTPRDLLWLAPNTPPPLTPAKVVDWCGTDCGPMLLNRDDLTTPLGYLELNPMPGQRQSLWLGHCILQPDHRGTGLGRSMVEMSLEYAFGELNAHDVSLIVFPENLSAVWCYLGAGFIVSGEQVKFFHTTGRHHRMLRMIARRP